MAGAILAHLLDAFIAQASSWAIQRLGEAWGDVAKQRENLKIKLSNIQAVLEHAEEQQFESEAVRNWLQNLKNVALDAEDLVEEIEIEAQQSRSAESGSAGGKKRKRGWDFSSFLSSSSSRWDLAKSIGEMNERLDEIAKQITNLPLESRQGNKRLEIIRGERRLVSSVRDESSQFLGRSEDTQQIMKSLMSDDDSINTKFSVIGIVGMGGVGKTTLAQVIYNDKTVTERFEVKSWVCVSEHFDVERVTKEIIADASKSTCDLSGKSWNALQCRLREILEGKKYLVVLDDVWSENNSEWEQLQAPFAFGARGSRIVVTSRSKAVLNAMQATWTHNLERLSQDDCRSLLQSRAFKDEEESKGYPRLLEIAEKLVEKCGGLPLAAKAVGGLLACTRQEEDWENILKSRIWNLKGSAGNILPALRLSYQHLPAHLKRCFTFCSVFPKDHMFVKELLVKMWIAHGFIRGEEGREIEETGSEYFNDLLLRSFFQLEFRRYKMHDLVHDLAQFIAGHDCFEEEEGKSHGDPRKIRHLSCTLLGPIVDEGLEPFYESRGLRTLLVLKRFVALKLPQESFERLRFIRVLDLSWTGIRELPDTIGNLKLLRYLNLSNTEIEELPESICSIYSMKTFLLQYCSKLRELPNEMRKLIRLRHLDLKGCDNIISMPPEIGRLVCLQELPLFVVGRERGNGIAELKELGKIRGRLQIKQLENVADSEDARQANLKDKSFIDDLELVWSGNRIHNSQDEGVEDEIANGLQPHPNLKSLRFNEYRGAHFPIWMMKVDVPRLFPNLHTLELYNCRRCNILPPLGCLPSLSVLYIQGMDEVKHIGREVWGLAGEHGFPSLKRLAIQNMVNLEQWHESDEVDFPCLERLCIYSCPQLRQIPSSTPFPNLKELDIQGVHKLEQVEGDFSCLEQLLICNCPQLRRMTSSTHLSNLKILHILNMHNLEQLEGGFSYLEKLWISNCPLLLRQMLSIPLHNLTELDIRKCEDLEALPLLPSLCKLSLGGDISDGVLKSAARLTFLSSLTLCGILNRTSLPRGMLHPLTQLKDLTISLWPQLVTLLEGENGGLQDEHHHLPSTLTYLCFSFCRNLKSLPRGLHALTCLRTLRIEDCPRVTSLPEGGLPIGLRTLQIQNCAAELEMSVKEAVKDADWPRVVIWSPRRREEQK